MRTSALSLWISALVLLVGHPCRASISLTSLDEPTVLWSEFASVQTPLDLDLDGVDDFSFSASVSFVGVHPKVANQYLIYPSPPPNIGGPVEPLPDGFEIGPNSGEGELDWYGSTGYSTLVQCLSGSGGYTCAGHFPGQRAYMGVEFDIEGATHYGWIDLYVAEYGPYAEIYGWAYETQPGISILAGAVPEPSTLVLLLVGIGTLALRGKCFPSSATP